MKNKHFTRWRSDHFTFFRENPGDFTFQILVCLLQSVLKSQAFCQDRPWLWRRGGDAQLRPHSHWVDSVVCSRICPGTTTISTSIVTSARKAPSYDTMEPVTHWGWKGMKAFPCDQPLMLLYIGGLETHG